MKKNVGKLYEEATAEFNAVENPAQEEYRRTRDAAWAEYEKVTGPARAKYEKLKVEIFDKKAPAKVRAAIKLLKRYGIHVDD